MNAKHIDIAEFRSAGYLQELNRRFLHPLGLALEVIVEDDGTESLGGVWDYRADSEGIYYEGLGEEGRTRAGAIDALWKERESARVEALGFMVQPA
jgi:hypothetical protein